MSGIISRNRKAIGGALATLSATVLTAATSTSGLTSTAWIIVAATTLGSFAVVWQASNDQTPATDDKPVAVPQVDASGTVVSTAIVPGPAGTIAHYEPPSRLDALDGVGQHRADEDGV